MQRLAFPFVFGLVATNDLGEPIQATPAIAGGRLLVRTGKALYCFRGDTP